MDIHAADLEKQLAELKKMVKEGRGGSVLPDDTSSSSPSVSGVAQLQQYK